MAWIALALVAVFAWWVFDRRFIGVSFKNSSSSDELRGHRNRFDRRMEELIRRAEKREAVEARMKRLAEAKNDIAPENYLPRPRELNFGEEAPISAFGANEREVIAGQIIKLCQRPDRWAPVVIAELRQALLVRNERHVNYESVVDFDISDFLSANHIVASEDGVTIRVTRTFVDRCAKSYRDHPPIRHSA
jgi:hypothetical protein